jgi:hypothetical protein
VRTVFIYLKIQIGFSERWIISVLNEQIAASTEELITRVGVIEIKLHRKLKFSQVGAISRRESNSGAPEHEAVAPHNERRHSVRYS